MVIFDTTLGGRYGLDSTFHRIIYREFAGDMDTPPTPFTGRRDFVFPGTHNLDAQMTFDIDDPTPFTLLAIAAKAEVGNV